MNKSKLNLMIAILGSLTILMVSGLVFNQIHNYYQTNQLIIDQCFEEYDTVEKVVVKQGGLLSPVSCEKI